VAEPDSPAVRGANARAARPGEDARARLIEAGGVVGVAVVTAVALAGFVAQLLPGVGFWDTAIFQAAPPVLGLTHPTGFPTLMLLGWAWVHLLPFLSPATALNLLTAVSGALAIGLVAAIARRLGAGLLPASAAALAVAFSVTFWRTSARADPHPLHVLLALLVIALLLAWDRRRDGRLLVGAALVFGLGMGNHALMALVAPGVGVFVLTARPSPLRQPRLVAAAALALAAGLTVYAYVPLRAAAGPAIHYDYEPATWPLFWRYVLGQDFAGSMTFLGPEGPGVALRELGTFVGHTAEAFTAPVLAVMAWLALVGAGALLVARRWRVTWLLLAVGGLTLYARLTYSNGDLERYALLPLALMAVLAAVGATTALDRIGLPGPFRQVASAGLLVVPAALAVVNASAVQPYSARCYVDAVVADLPADAGVAAWWSAVTPIWYAQAIEGALPGAEVVSASSTAPDVVARLWSEGRPVYLVQLEPDVQRVRDAGWTLEPVSFCGMGAWRVTAAPGASRLGEDGGVSPAAVSPWARRRS
jgi:hypothetical protein